MVDVTPQPDLPALGRAHRLGVAGEAASADGGRGDVVAHRPVAAEQRNGDEHAQGELSAHRASDPPAGGAKRADIRNVPIQGDVALHEPPRLQDLPKGWNELPSAPAAAAFGDAFLARGERLGLIVPSAVIPEASNIVVNPRHPQMAGVTMAIIRDFACDPRRRP